MYQKVLRLRSKCPRVSLKHVSIMLLAGMASMPQGFAAPYPGSGAPIAAFKQMAPEGDPNNPFSYPLLRDIAKSMVKNGLPATFLLGMENKSGPGIDLRSILLFEAGFFKSPVKLFMTQRKKPSKSDAPTLSVSPIPDSTGEMPTDAPKLNPPGSLEVAGAQSRAAAAAAADKTAEDNLNLDFKGIPDATGRPLKKHKNGKSATTTVKQPADVGELALAPPVSLTLPNPPTTEGGTFRFWTIPQVTAMPIDTTLSKLPYSGSFVMLSGGGLKAVDGRNFSITKGQMLASSDNKPISVVTPAAKVEVGVGATVFVEIPQPGVTRIRVIEAKPGDDSVSVKYDLGGKNNDLRLAAGEDLLVADHDLTDGDKAVQEKSDGGTAGGGSNWSKSKFQPKAILESNNFFDTDTPHQNPEQRSAIMSLRQRLK